jgi:hypothetical protein
MNRHVKTTTKTTTKNASQEATPGFAILINRDTDLGIAMLIAEDEDGNNYEPVGPVANVNEAYEIAASNLSIRMDEVEQGKDVMCPYAYRVCGWPRGNVQLRMVDPGQRAIVRPRKRNAAKPRGFGGVFTSVAHPVSQSL